MKKEYYIEGYTILVSFEPKMIHIINDIQLEKLLSENLVKNAMQLVTLIKKDYIEEYHRDLQVSDSSMLIEIWGHVYFEYFTVLLTRIFPTDITDKIAEWVIGHCAVIDSGEKYEDTDRKFWDILVPFRDMIGELLSKVSVR